jgi:hypothetical protein
VHAPKANRGFINLAQSRPKVNFSKRKVKEKDKEYSSGYRESAFQRADKTVLSRAPEEIYTTDK